MQTGLRILAGLLLFGLLAGFGGAWHPLGDSLAVLRVPLAAALLIAGLAMALMRPRRSGVLVAGVAALAITASFWPQLGIGAAADRNPGNDISIYQKNLLWQNRDLQGIERDIRGSGADAVTLQEVGPGNRGLLTALADLYPHQHLCEFNGWNAIAVLSRYPIERAGDCTVWRTAASARIAHPMGAFTLVSVHLQWPWPYDQAASRDILADMIDNIDGPVVLAGDFNAMPWSYVVRSLARQVQGRVIGPLKTTIRATRYRVPMVIDFVIAPDGQIERRPQFGSDHFGLLARFQL